jgi:serine/threonine protein phosphatase PrpC
MLYTIEDIGLRNYQEDRHSICFNFFQDFHYLAVFDGHGDDKVAIFLKLYLKDVIKRELINFYPSKIRCNFTKRYCNEFWQYSLSYYKTR